MILIHQFSCRGNISKICRSIIVHSFSWDFLQFPLDCRGRERYENLGGSSPSRIILPNHFPDPQSATINLSSITLVKNWGTVLSIYPLTPFASSAVPELSNILRKERISFVIRVLIGRNYPYLLYNCANFLAAHSC